MYRGDLMRLLKYFLIFTLVSLGISLLVYVITGGNALFLLGGIPLVFGGYWSFGNKPKEEE